MFKPVVVAVLSFFLPFSGSFNFLNEQKPTTNKANSGTLEKLIVADGNVVMNLDMNRLNGISSRAKRAVSSELRFDVEKNSFFTVMVFDGELRGALPSSMALNPKDSALLPAAMNASYKRLDVTKAPYGEPYEFVVRDGETGFVYFNVEGHEFEYIANERVLSIQKGRMLISNQFAGEMGRPGDAGRIVGEISITANMRPIEVIEIVDGEVKSDVMPSLKDSEDGTVPGPDVIVGDVYGLAQFGGSFGTQVGLAVGTNSCNFGTEDLHWDRLPSNDHPVIPQNLYRLSSDGSRIEQIGQSSVKHAFTALTQDLCNLGCNGVGGSRLGSGCSDPYSASLNAGPNLGSRAWINPFDGDYPRGDSATPPNSHTGHSHTGPAHKILTEIDDLRTSLNAGARYFAEGHYVTPHEYVWCQSNPGQCNMYNNASYREYNVSGDGSPFSFSAAASTERTKPAIQAWTGATFVDIEPDPGNDGIGTVAYKVTQPSPGVWHYEYAVYNQNLDRAIQAFEVPLGSGVTLSNVGFHAPPQHPGWSNDGTDGDAGFSGTPWTESQTATAMNWSTQTFAQNMNANAIRWGTTYNFRFDSNSPPQAANATVGFFKTGGPITVQVMAPVGGAVAAVSISGRVMDGKGRPLPRTYISVTGPAGVLAAWTNHFGYYRVDGIEPGQTYTIDAFSKGIVFDPQVMDINGSITGIDFTPVP